MIRRISAGLAALVVPLLLAACDGISSERGSVTLTPERLATLTYRESGDDVVCGLDRAGFPPTILESSLETGEIGAGFRNWFRHEQLCRRRYTWIHEGLVAFDAAPLRGLGLAGVRRATLRASRRPLAIEGEPVASIAGDLSNNHCPELRVPTESWAGGFRAVANREGLVDTRPFREGQVLVGGRSRVPELAIDVTDWARRQLRPGSNREPELAVLSISPEIGQNNNAFCFVILGDFRLDVEFDRLLRAGS